MTGMSLKASDSSKKKGLKASGRARSGINSVIVSTRTVFLPRAQHVYVGHAHLPRKIIPKMPIWDPQNEFSGSAFLGITIFFNRKS